MYKICSKCKKEQHLSNFYSDKRASDGKQSQCKDCHKSFYRTESGMKAKKRCYSQEKRRKLYLDNLEQNKSYSKRYYNKVKDSTGYRVKKSFWQSLRQSRKCKATPSWLSEKQTEFMEDFYWLAKDLTAVSGEDYHVDHIVPLKGKNVCGLHVPWNLQILPADINLSKGNKYDNLA